MESNDASGTGAQSPRAERMLAIDDEIASLQRVSPKLLRYGASLISLLLMLGAVVVVSSSSRRLDVAWLYLIGVFLILVGVPAAIYGALLSMNRRQRLRLEREMDELIADHEGARPSRLMTGS
jgi:hypothetical protein